MSRAEKVILAVTLAVLALVVVLEQLTPKEPNWQPSYTRYRTDPFACGLAYDRLTDLFPQGVTTVREPIYVTAQERLATDSTDRPVIHIFINSGFHVDDLDLENLLKMVDRGDDAFIAAQYFPDKMMDTLRFRTEYQWKKPDSLATAAGLNKLLRGDTDLVRFTSWPLRQVGDFQFAHGGIDYIFKNFGMDSVQVLAENQHHAPVLLRMRHGKGSLWLCTAPRAFTNYYLLKDGARGFMEGAFNMLPDRPVLWDEYYKVGRAGSRTPLRYILSQPALKWAYWTAMALLLLTVLVYARRRQRAIPVVTPPRNTSREFADTMGRLYYFRGDHADIARKLTVQFKDEVRRKLRLHRTIWDAEAIQEIALRTGISEEELNHANRLMDHYNKVEQVSEEQLLTLNKTLSSLRSRL
ncbi:MAG: hypothetical protein IPO60_11730 [Flavobacteriales bacterium]|jgi:hypothetical protein|nr:hypothetical protein [Flavobacteriales bacterium]MBK6893952.1 hypothetical protein [Flavobacteriales bacterium]MBK7247896.1 hypothetical protein [Flavobacteriales bacterium]MBK7287118.1 hypothetical protein [Flavobacteriales bacterium]MBK9598960.1 hypothetical protein [Flavobacteriales bacterium]